MTDEEMVDRIDGLHAHDGGSVQSGIHDPVFKQQLRSDPANTERLLKLYLIELMSKPEYTFEDAASLVLWARDELGLEYF